MIGYEFDKSVQIKNTQVYKFKDNTYIVSFDANKFHHVFRGTREQIVPQIALRVKRILHVR